MRLAAALVVLATAGGGTVALARHDWGSAPSRSGAPVEPPVVPGRVVHVDSGVRMTTFLPLGRGPQDGRTLSAQHAYNALVLSASKLSPIPATVRAYYGVLAAPAAVDVRVWGFAVASDCSPGAGSSPTGASTPAPPTRCRLWEFVDARTGHDVGGISREVLPD